ncbi:MAG: hypothetical protein AB1938_28715, partial [Myxococcota bacterium]
MNSKGWDVPEIELLRSSRTSRPRPACPHARAGENARVPVWTPVVGSWVAVAALVAWAALL